MKLISWNVNGIRACVQKGFLEFFQEADADIFCIQESKMQAGQLDLELIDQLRFQIFLFLKYQDFQNQIILLCSLFVHLNQQLFFRHARKSRPAH